MQRGILDHKSTSGKVKTHHRVSLKSSDVNVLVLVTIQWVHKIETVHLTAKSKLRIVCPVISKLKML